MQDGLEGVFNFSYNAWRNLSLVFTLHFLATSVFFFFLWQANHIQFSFPFHRQSFNLVT